MNWALIALKKYAVFEGRARRMEYWFFFLFYILASIACTIIDVVTGSYNATYGTGLLSSLLVLALFLPSLGVTIRRLHDTDRSGLWILIGFVPCIGWLVLLVFMILEGTNGSNRFGQDPTTQPA
jgi:uncharacterized membrane protein YhaH (DUF805 family)